ncbi:MAG: hypothetical protein JSU63_16800 [Phycisphaerales bacterium]|nr:MAG: hypothetical protein JSU63_16800 [Phycisphaerales bacterium]
MKKNKVKATSLALLAGGAAFGGFGCLSNDSWWGKLLWDGVMYAGYEFVLDNDAVFDLWEDGEPTPAAE